MPIKDKRRRTFTSSDLYIRDSAAGIGTMTFYHPESKKYGALGHVISDMDTKKPIVVDDGKLYNQLLHRLKKEVTEIQVKN